MKYRAKSVEIEAFQYDGDLINTKGEYYVPEWAVKAYENGLLHYGDDTYTLLYELFVKTSEGILHVDVGDFVIKGVNGELYPCKPDIFKKMYDIIEK